MSSLSQMFSHERFLTLQVINSFEKLTDDTNLSPSKTCVYPYSTHTYLE